MKYYRVIYQPTGRHHKEWMVWEGENTEQVHKQFNAGIIINIEEISEQEFKDNFEGY